MNPSELAPEEARNCPVCGKPGIPSRPPIELPQASSAVHRATCSDCHLHFNWGAAGWMCVFDPAKVAVLIAELQKRVLEVGGRALPIDFAGCEFLESASLCRLIEVDTELKAKGCRLALYNLRDEMREVFAITQLDRVFEIH